MKDHFFYATPFVSVVNNNNHFCQLLGLQQIGVLAESELIPKSVVYTRPTLLETGSYHRTVVIWVNQVKEVLRMFSETPMFCQQKIDVGVYDPSDRSRKSSMKY